MRHRARIAALLAVVAAAVLLWAVVVVGRRQALLQRIAVLESLAPGEEACWREATVAAKWIRDKRATEGIPALQHALAVTRYHELTDAAVDALLLLGPEASSTAERYLLESARSGESFLSGWGLLKLRQLGRESQVSTRELCGVLACEYDLGQEAAHAALIARGGSVVGEVAASCAALRFERRGPFIDVLRAFRAEAVSWIDARLEAVASEKEKDRLREIRDELVPGERSPSPENE